MSLVYDRRTNLEGKPCFHALIIGVSAYPYLPKDGDEPTPGSFGMRQVESTALAAFRIYEWLSSPNTALPVPLATCRLLLCPTEAEIQVEPALKDLSLAWGLDEVVAEASAWRADASTSRNHITFFYFAGHGARRSAHDSVMILPEFAKPNSGGVLARCIDTQTIRDGMVPSELTPDIARTQMYFVDACRIEPDQFEKFRKLPTFGVFDAEADNIVDDRQAPVFYAALPGTAAVGLKGKDTLFSRALLSCLRGAAGEAMDEDANGNVRWRVSVNSLNKSLPKVIEDLNIQCGTQQDYEPGACKDVTVCELPSAPPVGFTLELDPPGAAQFATLDVRDYKGDPAFQMAPPIQPHPLPRTLPAGQYSFKVNFDPQTAPFQNFQRIWPVLPPSNRFRARI